MMVKRGMDKVLNHHGSYYVVVKWQVEKVFNHQGLYWVMVKCTTICIYIATVWTNIYAQNNHYYVGAIMMLSTGLSFYNTHLPVEIDR